MNAYTDPAIFHSNIQSSLSRIHRFEGNLVTEKEDMVVVEEPLEIRQAYPGPDGEIYYTPLVLTLRTPGADFDLVRGFLFSEGIIQKSDDIISMRFAGSGNEKKEQEQTVIVNLSASATPKVPHAEPRLYMSSSCGLCGKSSLEMLPKLSSYLIIPDRPVIKKELLGTLPGRLGQAQTAFKQTGGIHACGLFDTAGNLLVIQEDVGRHNALDKLIGTVLKQNMVPLRDQVLVFSGRLGFELVQKALMAGAAFLCSIGAPTSLAIQLAEESGMTMVGFLSQNRFNVYCGKERIE